MRGTRAKLIRKQVYGSDGAAKVSGYRWKLDRSRNTRYVIADTKRQLYQRAKREWRTGL